jgi:GWxTD domain-containing protein
MKKSFLIILLGIFSFSTAYSQNLQAFMSYTLFDSPADGPYIETYVSIYGPSVEYVKKENGKFQGTIEVTIIFRQDENIVDYDKYEVQSQELDDTTGIISNFLAQQRYLLANGSYDMEFIISDKNSDNEPYITTDPVVINFPTDKPSISGIELISEYTKSESPSILTKSGLDLYPYIFNFYPDNIRKIMFYCEFYNTDKQFGEGGKFVYNYYIQSYETKSQILEYSYSKTGEATAVFPILKEIDILNLPSGNYLVVVELRNQNNELVTKNQLFFQRSNPNIQFNTDEIAALNVEGTFVDKITNIDSLRQYIHYLLPISTQMDRNFIGKQMPDADMQTLKQYFLNFWKTRDDLYPELAWNHYHQQVDKVNIIYSTPNRKGYETDRGRVFLKYGPPNIVSESYHEPAAYPYEIWQYYALFDGQRNKKFVFYTVDIVTNDFQLVHSDAIGEVANYRWQIEIYKRTYDPYNIDVDLYPDAWGSNVHKYWQNPR